MILKCGSEYEEKILEYIGDDYPQCLYLYLDLKKYGFNSEVTDVFLQMENGNVRAVLLKYYSCLHIFSKNCEFDASEICTFIAQNDLSMVYCTKEAAVYIYSNFPDGIKCRSEVTAGWVAQIKKIDKIPQKIGILAQNEDFEQIVKLIYEDEDIGRSYKLEELAKQLEERNQQGYARNLVIKEGNLVVAHACTNAETEDIAVVAELLVHKDYRRKGYGSEIWREICDMLLAENKSVFSFYYSDESRNLHKKIGFTEICEWGKIVIV